MNTGYTDKTVLPKPDLLKDETKKKKILFYFLIIPLILLFMLIVFVLLLYFGYRNRLIGNLIYFLGGKEQEDNIVSKNTFTILLYGIDRGIDPRGRADSIMLIHVSKTEDYVAIMSIPRDLLVKINNGKKERFDKINHAYFFGGEKTLQRTIEYFLGIDIDYFFEFNFDGFKKLIDEIGGVEIEVEKRMKYKDRAQNLFIDLYPGKQVLNGEKAMHYVRFRHDAEGDYGRIKRQQKFLFAAFKQVLSLGNFHKLPTIIKNLKSKDLIKTNVEFNELLYFLSLIEDYKKQGENSKILSYTLPTFPKTIGGISYVIVDTKETDYLIKALFKGGYKKINKNIKISLWNGSGYPELGNNVKRKLRYFNYNVVSNKISKRAYDETYIISCGNEEFADDIVRYFNGNFVNRQDGCGKEKSDIIFIVGKDYIDN